MELNHVLIKLSKGNDPKSLKKITVSAIMSALYLENISHLGCGLNSRC